MRRFKTLIFRILKIVTKKKIKILKFRQLKNFNQKEAKNLEKYIYLKHFNFFDAYYKIVSNKFYLIKIKYNLEKRQRIIK